MLKAKEVFTVFIIFCLVVVASLDCYKCSTSVASACLATTSCGSGEVCSKEVFKRYFLTTIYDKGCLTRGTCRSLANLNDDRYCSVAPSTCTYCCDSDLCNGSSPNVIVNGQFFIIASICLLFFTL